MLEAGNLPCGEKVGKGKTMMFGNQGLSQWMIIAALLTGCASTKSPSAQTKAASPLLAKADEFGLVDIRTVIPDIAIDLRYATADNITGRVLYPADMPCLVWRSTAHKLQRVQDRLRAEGCRLCIWDAWRPPEVQTELMRKGGHTGMFLDPQERWSRHCSGVAVDVTLVDLEGRPMKLPTAHDEHSDAAYYQYSGTDPEVKRNVTLLQKAMEAEGFSMIPMEWWHFDDFEHFYNPPPTVFASQLELSLP